VSEPMERTEAIVKRAKALGADQVIARTTLSRSSQIRFSNNQVDISKAWNEYVTEVALAWQKRVVATEIYDFKEADERVGELMKLAKVSEPNPMYAGFAEGTYKYGKPKADRGIASLEEPILYVERAIEAAKEEVPEGLNAGGTLLTSYEDVYLVSSEGPSGHDARSSIEVSVRAFSQEEASGHGVECSSTLREFEPERAGRKAGEIATLAEDPVPGEEGTYDVVFDPLFTGCILDIYANMASAYRALIQLSIFGDKLGKRVAPETVTIRDRPAPYSVANRLFDDEGVPCRENVVIDHGVLRTLLHNTQTASIFKTETTGNAGLVVPGAWNLELDAGDMIREELFEEAGEGLYLTNTWYTRFQNYATGDFSTIPRDGAFVLRNGEVEGSIKDIRLSDNALRMLGSITAISEERQHIHSWSARTPSLSPYILIRDVRVTRPK